MRSGLQACLTPAQHEGVDMKQSMTVNDSGYSIRMPKTIDVDREQMRQMCILLYAADTDIGYFPANYVVHKGELYDIDYECNA